MYKKIKSVVAVLAVAANVVLWSSKLRSAVITFYNQGGNAILCYSTNIVYDLNKLSVGRMSAQVSLSTVTTAASSFSDGGQSTGALVVSSWTACIASRSVGTVTISSRTALAGATAYTYVSITSNTAVAGRLSYNSITVTTMTIATTASFVLNGKVYTSSESWSFGASSNTAAVSIMQAINRRSGSELSIIASTAGAGNIVEIYAERYGVYANTYTLTTSTTALIIGTTGYFTGGEDPVKLTLNRTNFATAGIQYQTSAFSTQTAYNLAQALDGLDYGIRATTGTPVGGGQSLTGSSVTVALTVIGSVYNSYQLISSSPTAIMVLSSTSNTRFIGGADPAIVKINGVQFKNGVDWFTREAASCTAQSLFFAISSNAATSQLIASTAAEGATTGIVTLTAISSGPAYNYPLFTSTQSALSLSGVATTVSGSTTSSINGGHDNVVIGINGVYLRQGTDWFAALSNTQTAASISNAIMSNASLNRFVISSFTVFSIQQSSPGVVYSTSIFSGASQNFALYTSSQTAISIASNTTVVFADSSSGSAKGFMCGGSDVGYSTITDIIRVPNNTFATGMAVLYTTGGAQVTINPLLYATTYFVIMNDTSSVKLALTSSGAIAGIPIDLLGLSTQTTAHTFTLTPIPPLGTVQGHWQVSNDSATWFDVAGTTTSFSSPYVSTGTFNDLNLIQNARYARYKIDGSTSGAFNFGITINGRAE